MKWVVLLSLAAQLPFTAVMGNPLVGPVVPATVTLPAVEQAAQSFANEEKLRELLASTVSVMKRPGDITSERPAEVTPGAAGDNGTIRDNAVVQTAFNQLPGGKQQSPEAPSAPVGGQTNAGNPGQAATGNNSAQSGNSTQSEPLSDETRSAAAMTAELLAGALTPSTDSALEGRPVSLADALSRVANPAQRLEVAAVYWKLALALADYHWAFDESLQLGALPGNKDAVDSPLLAAAQAAAQARMFEAKAAAVTAQQELADAIGQPTQPLPLTVEKPLVGPYRTEFDAIFAGRVAPGRSRAIHRALPHWREALDLRTAAVQAAASAVAPAEAAYGEGKASVETVLLAHRELAQQRRAFLNAVRQYNAEIVEYASYVAGPATSIATLVSMLTRSKPPQTGGTNRTFTNLNEPTLAPLHDANVQPAGAEEPLDDAGWKEANENAAAQPMP
jgi:hypothetical protein